MRASRSITMKRTLYPSCMSYEMGDLSQESKFHVWYREPTVTVYMQLRCGRDYRMSPSTNPCNVLGHASALTMVWCCYFATTVESKSFLGLMHAPSFTSDAEVRKWQPSGQILKCTISPTLVTLGWCAVIVLKASHWSWKINIIPYLIE